MVSSKPAAKLFTACNKDFFQRKRRESRELILRTNAAMGIAIVFGTERPGILFRINIPGKTRSKIPAGIAMAALKYFPFKSGSSKIAKYAMKGKTGSI